ncbi:hypothetical protein D3C76_1390600 [compost metagenome]
MNLMELHMVVQDFTSFGHDWRIRKRHALVLCKMLHGIANLIFITTGFGHLDSETVHVYSYIYSFF